MVPPDSQKAMNTWHRNRDRDRFTIVIGIEVERAKEKELFVPKSVFHFLSHTDTQRHVSSLMKSLCIFLRVIYSSFKTLVIL